MGIARQGQASTHSQRATADRRLALGRRPADDD
jgi:hypothetical protein